MKDYQYLIIGGGIAGGEVAEGIREVDPGGRAAIITREEHPPYQKPPLSKGYLRDEVDLDHVYLEGEKHYQDLNVDLYQGKAAVSIHPGKHRVELEGGEEIGYQKLLLATGGEALRLPIWGNELKNVFTLRRIEDAELIRKVAGENQRALILGGSFIGSETAASLSQMDSEVVQVFPESRLLEPVVPAQLSGYIRELFDRNHIRVLSGTVAEKLEGDQDDAIQSATLDTGERLEIDLVIMGVGIELNTALAADADLEVAEGGAVLVNDYLQTSHPDIYAAGDIVSWPDPVRNQRLQIEHWDVARAQGNRAGRNMAGEKEAYTRLPYFFSDMFDLSFEVWGVLDSWDQTVQRGEIVEGSFAFYYFDQGQLVGVLSVGRPEGEREAMKTLPEKGITHAESASKLADESYSLNQLLY